MPRPTTAVPLAFALALLIGAFALAQEPTERTWFRGPNSAPQLTVSSRLVAVAAVDARSHERLGDLMARIGLRQIEDLRDRRIRVVEMEEGRLTALLPSLRRWAGVHWAHPLRHAGAPGLEASRWILTEKIVVRFAPDSPAAVDPERALAALGLIACRPLEWLPGAWLVRPQWGHADPLVAVEGLHRRSDVLFAHPDWLRRLGTRELLPNDPLFGNQWHLRNTGQGGGTLGADVSATEAWDIASGLGVTVAVIDTGVELTHPDLLLTPSGFDPSLGAGPNNGADIASHGTRVAGVVAAQGQNGNQISGAAPAATVMPIRLLTGGGYGTPSEEAACFVHATDNGADVITNSWGPDGVPFFLPPLVDQAFDYATSVGRGGLGCPIFWASGNANEDIVGDEYVSSTYTIAVGATTNFDLRAGYSDWGAALDLVAPSSGGTRAVCTTDVNGGTTLAFGGTSAAAPLAAGVAALMLHCNASLTWTEVRDHLRASAAKIQPAIAQYDASGHSLTYGYGRLDAFQAVQAAMMASALPAPQLAVFSWGFGDINIHIAAMPPQAEWALAISSELHQPLGSGPLFGVGMDAWETLSMPLGTIPFHDLADATGSYAWGALGAPAGITFQAVTVVVTPDWSLLLSNPVQVSL